MHRRLDRIGCLLTITDAVGDQMLLEHAVYLKTVSLVHDPDHTYRAGAKGEAFYVRLCPCLVGGSFIAYLSRIEADILREKGCPFETFGQTA